MQHYVSPARGYGHASRMIDCGEHAQLSTVIAIIVLVLVVVVIIIIMYDVSGR